VPKIAAKVIDNTISLNFSSYGGGVFSLVFRELEIVFTHAGLEII